MLYFAYHSNTSHLTSREVSDDMSFSQEEQIMRLNREQTRLLCFNQEDRHNYRDQFGNIELTAVVCADGRAGDLSEITGVPFGIWQKIRAVGAEVDPSWPAVKYRLKSWAKYCSEKKRHGLFVPTSHHSKEGHGNCAGHNGIREASLANAVRIRDTISRLYPPTSIFAPVFDFDTDTGSITFVGRKESFDIYDLSESDRSSLGSMIRLLYPECPEPVAENLSEMARRNLDISLKYRNTPKQHLEVVHNENGIAFGLDVDWMPNNLFMRIGPYSLDLRTPILQAAQLVHDNRVADKHPEGERAILLTTGVYYDESGPDYLFALEEARALAEFAEKIIHEAHPELHSEMDVLSIAINHHNRSAINIKEALGT